MFQKRKKDPFFNVNQTNTVKFLRDQVFKGKESNADVSFGSSELKGRF